MTAHVIYSNSPTMLSELKKPIARDGIALKSSSYKAQEPTRLSVSHKKESESAELERENL